VSVIFNLDGLPSPPSDMVARLQAVDPTLNMVFVPGQSMMDGSWAITQKWSPNDPRRRGIIEGKWPATGDHDAIVFLPKDCPLEQAFGYFANAVRRSSKADVRNMMDRLHLFNKQQKEENWAPVMEEAVAQVEANASTLFEKEIGTIPKSFGGLDKPKRKPRRKR
ncbi:MAG: hypothetical protein ACTS5I_09005, partial [Rhodanobacter sp.]